MKEQSKGYYGQNIQKPVSYKWWITSVLLGLIIVSVLVYLFSKSDKEEGVIADDAQVEQLPLTAAEDGVLPPICGDLVCDVSEENSCPGDCNNEIESQETERCGDAICTPTENIQGICPQDCTGESDQVDQIQLNREECGDGICTPTERNEENCQEDCT